ncbi:MAG TPA: hypothetical protein VLB02_00230, partial [Candidatus Paceibacterota bacterium]|nr:hypothetical protein [Candidatus Paceibacterota bacterium]
MRKILFILLIIILAGSVFLYFWTKNTPVAQQNGVQSAVRSFFPVGKDVVEQVTQSSDTPFGNQAINREGVADTTSFEIERGEAAAVSHAPVAGFFLMPTSTIGAAKQEDIVRYAGRESGFVYQVQPGVAPLQITNITLGNVYEALFTNAGNGVVLRFLREDGRTIGSYYVPIPEADADGV